MPAIGGATAPRMDDLHFFDAKQDYTIAHGRLPHWAQAGTLCFITWRTADSLPKASLARLKRKREAMLNEYGIDATSDWKQSVARLPKDKRQILRWSLFEEWEGELDRATGACVLREPELSQLVLKSLLHFDDDRYALTDAVVMPNHVHLLAAFRTEEALKTQCTSWKHYTAREINSWLRMRAVGGATAPQSDGEFWQKEQFDHLVRSEEEFVKYRRYIAENPRKARLKPGEFRHYSKD